MLFTRFMLNCCSLCVQTWLRWPNEAESAFPSMPDVAQGIVLEDYPDFARQYTGAFALLDRVSHRC